MKFGNFAAVKVGVVGLAQFERVLTFSPPSMRELGEFFGVICPASSAEATAGDNGFEMGAGVNAGAAGSAEAMAVLSICGFCWAVS